MPPLLNNGGWWGGGWGLCCQPLNNSKKIHVLNVLKVGKFCTEPTALSRWSRCCYATAVHADFFLCAFTKHLASGVPEPSRDRDEGLVCALAVDLFPRTSPLSLAGWPAGISQRRLLFYLSRGRSSLTNQATPPGTARARP